MKDFLPPNVLHEKCNKYHLRPRDLTLPSAVKLLKYCMRKQKILSRLKYCRKHYYRVISPPHKILFHVSAYFLKYNTSVYTIACFCMHDINREVKVVKGRSCLTWTY